MKNNRETVLNNPVMQETHVAMTTLDSSPTFFFLSRKGLLVEDKKRMALEIKRIWFTQVIKHFSQAQRFCNRSMF